MDFKELLVELLLSVPNALEDITAALAQKLIVRRDITVLLVAQLPHLVQQELIMEI